MDTAILSISLSGDDVGALFTAVAKDPFFGFPQVATWKIDGKEGKARQDWQSGVPREASKTATAFFDDENVRFMGLEVGSCVKAKLPWRVDVEALLAVIARLPCTLVAVGPLHRDWLSGELKLPNKLFGFAHHPYASFAAFKGAGHARLVSRRWVDHGGPWLAHHGANDTSLLQLHDLAADSRTANAQVRRAQERLGPGDTGGYIHPGFKRTLKLDVQYSGRDRKASIVVAKREVSQLEMLEAATLRGSNALGADSPIDAVAFVYIDEPQARRDLHELWLRGLECWTYIDGRETRIDEGYQPPPQRPW
jgi:hypothetical protein